MTKHYTDEGTLLIRNSDIKDGKFEFGDNPIYLEKTFAEKNETRMHQIGDVITVHTGDVGTSAVITENEAKSIGFATIVTRPNPKIIDSNYLCSFLNTDKHKKWAVSISTGDGRTNYNLGDYFELVVPVPSIAEQKKIASYIQKLNRLITLHQREFAFLCKEKSKKFRYIKNAWEQRKLGDLTESIKNGYTYRADGSRDHRYKITRIESISSGVINTEKLGSSDEVNENYRLVDGDILFSHINSLPYIANTALYTADLGEIYHGMNLLNIRSRHEEIDSHFLLHLLKKESTRDWFRIIAKPAVNQASISTTEVGSFKFLIPGMEEQKKISSSLDNLDNLITLHQRKPNFYTGGYYAE